MAAEADAVAEAGAAVAGAGMHLVARVEARA